MKRPVKRLAAITIVLFFWWAAGRSVDQSFVQADAGMIVQASVRVPTSEAATHSAAPLAATGLLHPAPSVSQAVQSEPATLTETYQGKPIRWWARRAVQARRDANKRGRTIRRLQAALQREHAPSFEHYFTIASLTYGVDRAMLERKGRCESVNFTDFYNETPIYNGEHAQGVMGFIPSTFNSTPYRGLDVRYDHLANIMAGAWMHARGRGGEWACR